MSNAREIKNRISSVKDTMKITNAMFMISSSKLKKAKSNLKNTQPYFYSLQKAIVRVIKRIPENVNLSYFDDKPDKTNRNIGYILITGDKGLAGAYNNNVIKIAEDEIKKAGNHVMFVAGNVGRSYFENKGINYDTEFKYTVQNPTLHRARVISGKIVQMFNEKELDDVYIIYTRMINSMESKAEIQKILPLKKADFTDESSSVDLVDETNYLPTPHDVLNNLIPNFVTGFIYGALIEAYSCEQNARMMAMESATNNAKDMLKELSIIYNRARQAAITQEVTEVISGAKAQKRK
ncbi:MAG: ATP synthase F1 subunit gamma [Sedimentibacter sp.]|uniref:ATP synthase F1 subunit gamma n=1 Tax=Sedimentibacter sp. TaxID=1960295 RepID=UPI003158DF27